MRWNIEKCFGNELKFVIVIETLFLYPSVMSAEKGIMIFC